MCPQNSKLTLYSPAPYRIKVLGRLDESWQDWAGEMTISFDLDPDDQPITSLTVSVDQAGLMGLLRRLYTLGLPILLVIWSGGIANIARPD
jgi:hypothetical protein